MDQRRRVVITSMASITALGFDESTMWQQMLDGRTGIKRVSSFDLEGYKSVSGAEVDSTILAERMKERGIRTIDRTVDLALIVSGVALEQAGLIPDEPPYEPRDTGVIFGVGYGAAETLYNGYMSFAKKGIRGVRATLIPRGMANATSAQVSMRYHLTGANYVISSACSSGTSAIAAAFRMIRDGYSDTMLCGGADAMFDPGIFAAWNNLGVMSRNQNPEQACRPFDAKRDGFVLGEGAGAIVLESLESAQKRGATIRAEICGFGEASDAKHITAPDPEGQARTIRAALNSAGITPAEVGFINAHGTATRANDAAECISIYSVFGKETQNVPVVSSKSYFGHLLGGSGAVETIAKTVLASAATMLFSCYEGNHRLITSSNTSGSIGFET